MQRTSEKMQEGETSQSSVVSNASLNELCNEGSGLKKKKKSTVIKYNESKWCITFRVYAGLQHVPLCYV